MVGSLPSIPHGSLSQKGTVLLQLTQHRLHEAYETALTMSQPDEVVALSVEQFATRYPDAQPWQIGPFSEVPELTFHAPLDHWNDPTAVGWHGTSVINPSLLPVGDDLHMFYRASPRMETLSSRLGHAVYSPRTGWSDDRDNPIIYPTQDNELLGCEDPKIYAAEGQYFLFYNGGWPIQPEHRTHGLFSGEIGCDINVAVSDDLRSWTKLGPVVPHEISGYWAKAAVIPRDGEGRAVKIGGQYLMFLSEGCFGKQVVGRSDDMVNWTWEQRSYLKLPAAEGKIHEVACAVVDGPKLILDFFWEDGSATYRAGQALYGHDDPFTPTAVANGGSLAWGGLVRYNKQWVFAQGWDASPGSPTMYFYGAA